MTGNPVLNYVESRRHMTRLGDIGKKQLDSMRAFRSAVETILVDKKMRDVPETATPADIIKTLDEFLAHYRRCREIWNTLDTEDCSSLISPDARG